MEITNSPKQPSLVPLNRSQENLSQELEAKNKLSIGQVEHSSNEENDSFYKNKLESEYGIKWEKLEEKYTAPRLLSAKDAYERVKHFEEHKTETQYSDFSEEPGIENVPNEDRAHNFTEEILVVNSLTSATLINGKFLGNVSLVGNIDLLQWIFKNYPELDSPEPRFRSRLLLDATYSGNIKLIDYYIDEKEIDPTEELLRTAASQDNLPLVKYFVEKRQIRPTKQITLEQAASGCTKEVFSYVFSKRLPESELKITNNLLTIATYINGNEDFISYLTKKINEEPIQNTLSLA